MWCLISILGAVTMGIGILKDRKVTNPGMIQTDDKRKVKG
jgi:hypothetical protein